MCKTLFHLALSCKRLHYLSPTLKNRCQDLTHFEKKKNVLNSCTQRYLCLSCSRILLLVSDNADEKTSSTVFNPAWAWLGAVVAILLLSTALVVIRKFKHNRRNSTHEDDHAANTEVVTGYTRFWKRYFSYKIFSCKNWKASVTHWKKKVNFKMFGKIKHIASIPNTDNNDAILTDLNLLSCWRCMYLFVWSLSFILILFFVYIPIWF